MFAALLTICFQPRLGVRRASCQHMLAGRFCRMDVEDDLPNLKKRYQQLKIENGRAVAHLSRTSRTSPTASTRTTARQGSPQPARKVKPNPKRAQMFAGTEAGLFEFGMMALGLDYASGTGPYSATMSATKNGACKILCIGVGGGGASIGPCTVFCCCFGDFFIPAVSVLCRPLP